MPLGGELLPPPRWDRDRPVVAHWIKLVAGQMLQRASRLILFVVSQPILASGPITWRGRLGCDSRLLRRADGSFLG